MYNIYLAGFISGNKLEECKAWRRNIREYFVMKDWPIVWLDPLNGEEFGVITDDGLKCALPGKSLVQRDYQSVEKADLIIANLTQFGDSRPLTGTIYELAWAWLLKKPTIVITTEINYKEHPFIQDTAGVIVETVEELLEKKYIQYFYRGSHTAKY